MCVCVCVCRFFSAGLKPKASACDGRCELTPIRRGNKKSSCFWDKAICYHSHPHRLDNGKVPRRRRRYKYMGGWWCVGQWRKKESRDATRQARKETHLVHGRQTDTLVRDPPPSSSPPSIASCPPFALLPFAQASPLLFQDQPLLGIGGGGGRIDNQTFPKISERTLWTLLGTVGALLAAGPGGVGARGPR